MKEQKFVMLTYSILQLEGLTSTDKIVLARRLGWGKTPCYEKPTTIAAVLCMKKKNVEKSISKLKRLGYWPNSGVPTRAGSKSTRVVRGSNQVGNGPTGVGASPTRVGDKKSFSPLKTECLLDSLLDNKLENNEIVGLDCSVETALKNLGEGDQIPKITQDGFLKESISGVSVREADKLNSSRRVPPAAPPLDANGKHLRDVDMVSANLAAWAARKPEPFTKEQMAAAAEWAKYVSPISGLLDNL
jgi:hypothetical protein